MPTNFDWAVFIAAVIAAIASGISAYYAYQSSNKTTFINTITSERIRWMEKLRETVSDLGSYVNKYSVQMSFVDEEGNQVGMRVPEYVAFRTELYKYIMLIRLLLNPLDTTHKPILKKLDLIKKHFNDGKSDELPKDACELVDLTQTVLKETWEKVKEEAREGELIKESIINPWMLDYVRRSVYPEDFAKGWT